MAINQAKFGANRTVTGGGRGGRGNVGANAPYRAHMKKMNSYNQPKTSSFGFPLGGLLGGRGGGARFAEDDLNRQLEYDKMVWERSTPNVKGVGGNVVWDRDTNTVSSTLSPEYQAIYDSMGGRQGMFGDLANNLASGGWQDAQKQLFDQQRALYAEGDQIALDQLREREVAMGRGAESTAGFHERRAMQSGIDQRDIGLMNNAFAQSQGLIDSNLNRQRNDVATMMNLGNVANNMVKTPTPYPQGNVQNVSTASTAWANQLAGEDIKRREGMSDMWGSILGGGGSGGGMLGSYIATATTQSIGEEGLKVFEDWRDYMFTVLPTFTSSFGRYRATAPKIVEEIDKKENSKALYKEIWDDYLKPIYDMIKEDKDNPKALSDYKVMVRDLTKKYLRR